MIEYQLPWPPPELSPNSRIHWAKKFAAKRKYRSHCDIVVLDQGVKTLDPEADYVLHMTFIPPDKRHYDVDNLIARMKSGLDGLCDALDIDDQRFSSVGASVSRDSIGGFVRVRIHTFLGDDDDS